ncbi:regulatory signaling modulator protein AmpE [Legionella fallonii]|uniref:Inner membrane protein AmpE n=1 Tax=Legionella fallonii LLAP-10 TaxID=1212491 RepID=A0A098G399_9GAMM|nr:regulatory signaling modulator protein AmpE [Legionella fallonii]CEG56938.1 conserved membrane protein of unknown function [Legionella fallonii LLAP-10]
MKLLVIVLCLLSERFLIHAASYQRFYWFGDYYLSIKKILDKSDFFRNPWMNFAGIIIPILLVVSLIYFLFSSMFFGFVGFVFSIVIFLYCLGPQNAFYPLSELNTETNNDTAVGNYFTQVNSQLFSVIFWYVVLGPIGALAYRLITLCETINFVDQQAKQLTDIVEWIPARISALLYLLVGNFQKGFVSFTKLFFAKPEFNHQMLSDCGKHAVRANDADEIPLPVAECLIEHATIVLMVFIALFTLASWM